MPLTWVKILDGTILLGLKRIYGLVFGNYQYGLFFKRRRASNSYSWDHYCLESFL